MLLTILLNAMVRAVIIGLFSLGALLMVNNVVATAIREFLKRSATRGVLQERDAEAEALHDALLMTEGLKFKRNQRFGAVLAPATVEQFEPDVLDFVSYGVRGAVIASMFIAMTSFTVQATWDAGHAYGRSTVVSAR